MGNLFKKVACFTDIHFGAKSNSLVHLQDCEEFIDWFIENAKKEQCETGIFLGDWSHNRNNINLITLDSSIKCLEKLGKAFNQFFWFPGNHDLYFKDKRQVHSSVFGKHIPGITIIDEITTIDNVTLVPWLIGDEWKQMQKLKSRYTFGHFELPLFYMNAMVQMPNHGELQTEHLTHQEYVFSGHFHKRQNKNNVWYIGNAFPHNFSDSWDDERGMMVLEWGKEPRFLNWDNCPKFRNISLSKLIENKDTIIKSKMHLKVNLDIDINFEEANFIKETFITDYNLREISLIQENRSIEKESKEFGEIYFEGVDNIITNSILSVESENFDKKLLLDIYNNL